jgi:hypothetical protein
MIFLMAAPTPTNWSEILTWEHLFPGVDRVIELVQIPFLGIAFVMLVAHVYGSIGKTAASRGLELAEWIRPFIVAAVASVCIANINTFTGIGIKAGEELAESVLKQTGGNGGFASGPQGSASMIWVMADQFVPSAVAQQKKMASLEPKDFKDREAFVKATVDRYAAVHGAPDADTADGLTERAHNRWEAAYTSNPLRKLNVMMSGFIESGMDYVVDFITDLVKMIIMGVVYLLLLVASFFTMLMGLVKVILLKLSGIMLPVFIAGVVTDYFRSQSMNYIFSMIGIMFWPVGWAIGSIGTLALAQAVIAVTQQGLGITTNSGGLASAGIMGFPLLHIVPTLFFIVVLSLLLVCWVVVLMLGFPVLIQRAVTSGANFAQSAMAGAGKMALNTAGAAMVTVGMGASAAAAMKAAGGSPSSGDTSSPPGPTDGGDSKALAKLGGFGDSVGDSSRGGGGGGGAGKGASGVASRRATRTTTDANGKTVTETVEEVYQSDTAPKGKDGDASPRIGAGGGGGGGGGGFAGALAQAAKNLNPLTALGRTMQNLAASDGSPESMYRVPDTGIDETRRAIAESMQAMRNNRNPPKA